MAQIKTIQNGDNYTKYAPLSVTRKALETPAHKFTDYSSEFPKQSTGRRTMLADWITSPENPLTARVAVNQVWMRHFREPLVESVFDFGRQAKQPRNAELLDYLAAEFIESGWSFRHLHRLIVTSKTFRRSSTTLNADAHTQKTDPGNQYYWRMNTRRMESQVVRDSLLHLSDQLDLSKLGGASASPKSGSTRRSLYFTHSPDKIDTFVGTFDDADLLQCYRRNQSVIPQQALALSNSKLAFESAAKLAAILDDADSPNEFIKACFTRILARAPDDEEIQECLVFLSEIPDKKRGRVHLVHALLNHNDFISIR